MLPNELGKLLLCKMETHSRTNWSSTHSTRDWSIFIHCEKNHNPLLVSILETVVRILKPLFLRLEMIRGNLPYSSQHLNNTS